MVILVEVEDGPDYTIGEVTTGTKVGTGGK